MQCCRHRAATWTQTRASHKCLRNRGEGTANAKARMMAVGSRQQHGKERRRTALQHDGSTYTRRSPCWPRRCSASCSFFLRRACSDAEPQQSHSCTRRGVRRTTAGATHRPLCHASSLHLLVPPRELRRGRGIGSIDCTSSVAAIADTHSTSSSVARVTISTVVRADMRSLAVGRTIVLGLLGVPIVDVGVPVNTVCIRRGDGARRRYDAKVRVAIGNSGTLHTARHITSHHITSHHITSHHITSHHITSHHITSHHITSHHITSHHITSLAAMAKQEEHGPRLPTMASCRRGARDHQAR